MCNGASDGDRYSGRTEPAQVSGAHGDGEAASPHFCVCFVGCALQSKIFIPQASISLTILAMTMRLMVRFTQSEETNR